MMNHLNIVEKYSTTKIDHFPTLSKKHVIIDYLRNHKLDNTF